MPLLLPIKTIHTDITLKPHVQIVGFCAWSFVQLQTYLSRTWVDIDTDGSAGRNLHPFLLSVLKRRISIFFFYTVFQRYKG